MRHRGLNKPLGLSENEPLRPGGLNTGRCLCMCVCVCAGVCVNGGQVTL